MHGRPRPVLAAALSAVLIAATLLVAAPPAQAAPPPTFVFGGSGFGHGVGMSQYGAYGQALEGRSATEILQHYYTGASVVGVTDAVPIRVNLLHAVPTTHLRGESLAAGGGSIHVTAGATTVDAGSNEVIVLGISGTQVTVSKGGSVAAQGDVASVTWSGDPTLLNVAGPGETFEQAGHRYRYGSLDVAVVGSGLEVVNQLNLHGEYLWGIAEVPSSWPAAALQAQVVAARTYAMRRHQSGELPECRCHVYDTVVHQVFAGWSKESGAGGANWVAAVNATSPDASTGLAVLSNGALITANYFSSSGGRTENNEDGFGGTPLPYLRSVDDRWSLASYNPRAAWSFTRTQAQVAAAFALPDVTALDLSDRTEGGSVAVAVATSSNGTVAKLAGTVLRSRLGLPGAWLRKPVVRVAGVDRYATSVAIGQQAATNPTTVVLASGEDAHLVDGLVAAPLAVAKSAPLLLATAGGLPDPVAAEIDRLHPATAYLVGGAASLGPGVETALRQRGVSKITRLGGADRYATGETVAREMGSSHNQVVIASGDTGHLVDALAAGGAAAGSHWPILLVAPDALPPATREALGDLRVQSTVVVGGTAAVSDAVMGELPKPRRLAGADRYATAVTVADEFSGILGVATVVVASGADSNLVDALPGGALGRITLLTTPSPLSTATRGWLRNRVDIGAVQVLGGPAAVAQSTFDAIRAAVGS